MDEQHRASSGDHDESQATKGSFLGDILGGLLGDVLSPQGEAEGDAGLAAHQAGVSPVIAQAVLALVAGRLAQSGPAGRTPEGQGADLHALLDQARQGQEIDQSALRATGLPQELSAKAGLDIGDALKILQKLLPWLAKLQIPGLLAAQGKPQAHPAKPKPSSSSSSHAAKPKPSRPKPASSAKPSHSATANKPKRPKNSSSSRPSSSTARPNSSKETTKPSASNRRKKPGGGSSRSSTEDLPENA